MDITESSITLVRKPQNSQIKTFIYLFIFFLYPLRFTPVRIRHTGRSLWPHGLRRGSAAACLLGLRIRITLRAWPLESVMCCQVKVYPSG